MELKLVELLKSLGIQYKNIDYYVEALTHPSYLNEHKDLKRNHYQRLEFLGDAFIEEVVSFYIFRNGMALNEGDLTNIRQELVKEEALSELARIYKFGQYIYLSNGENQNNGRDRSSILCDVFESVAAATLLDLGFDVASKIYTRIFNNFIKDKGGLSNFIKKNYKSLLNEKFTSDDERPTYLVVKEEGPANDKTFYVEVRVYDQVLGIGKGHSKQEAEQYAAMQALTKEAK